MKTTTRIIGIVAILAIWAGLNCLQRTPEAEVKPAEKPELVKGKSVRLEVGSAADMLEIWEIEDLTEDGKADVVLSQIIVLLTNVRTLEPPKVVCFSREGANKLGDLKLAKNAWMMTDEEQQMLTDVLQLGHLVKFSLLKKTLRGRILGPGADLGELIKKGP